MKLTPGLKGSELGEYLFRPLILLMPRGDIITTPKANGNPELITSSLMMLCLSQKKL